MNNPETDSIGNKTQKEDKQTKKINTEIFKDKIHGSCAGPDYFIG